MDFSLCFNFHEILAPKAARYLPHFKLKCDLKIPSVFQRFFMRCRFSRSDDLVAHRGLITEAISGFSDEMLIIPDGSVLYGFFQSQKYFEDIKELIQDDFQSTLTSFSDTFKTICHQIQNSESVAVHVRRKDYLRYTDFNICTNEYYRKAVEKIKTIIRNPVFFTFSDDICWARKNILIPNAVFVDLPDSQISPGYDLLLMAQCRHQIIANSTFSWWGAWLNQNRGKIVVAPGIWHKNPIKNERFMKNILPEQWFKLSF